MTTRQPQAPGVGKTAKRHDLETPKTPGLTDSDLQQGDVQRLEAATQAVPTQRPPTPSSSSKPRRTTSGGGPEAPDPIDFIGGRGGGERFQGTGGGRIPLVDAGPWMPLIRTVAARPGAGGAVGAALVRLLTTQRSMPAQVQPTVLDRQELDADLLAAI